MGGGKHTYLDPCCGWGIRLLSSAILGINYIGFDVNANLVPKLKELAEDIKTIKPDFNYQIYAQGSQYLIEDLIDTVDFTFTSPPYFNLEDYGNNDFEQENSYRNTNYQHWLDQFVEPLFECLSKYVKPEGLVAFNIKDFDGYTLEKDFVDLGLKSGLELNTTMTMNNIVRVGSKGSFKETGTREKQLIDNSELVYIFKK